MIRALVIIAVAGFITSVVCLSAAIAIGGPAAVAQGTWSWEWGGWDGHHHFGMWRSGEGALRQPDGNGAGADSAPDDGDRGPPRST